MIRTNRLTKTVSCWQVVFSGLWLSCGGYSNRVAWQSAECRDWLVPHLTFRISFRLNFFLATFFWGRKVVVDGKIKLDEDLFLFFTVEVGFEIGFLCVISYGSWQLNSNYLY